MTDTLTQLDLATQVLDLVRGAAGPDAQAEVLIDRTALAVTRFANSYIHQNVTDTTTTVRLRLHTEGRTAAGSTTLTNPDSLRSLVERTLTAARHCPTDLGWPGLAPASPAAGTGTLDEAIVAATPTDRADLVSAFITAAEGLTTAGYCRTRYSSATFANSIGQQGQGGSTEVALDGIARAGDADGMARLASARLSEVDGAVLGARAAAKARAGADPVELPPGRYEVVLEPTAVGDVLQCLAVYGFNGKAVNERRSFAELGEQQFDRRVSLVDDTVSADAVGLPFDGDGTAKHPLELVRDGVTAAIPHDRRSASQAGTTSTGHAGYGAGGWGPVPVNVRLAATAGPEVAEVAGPVVDSATAALIAGVRRGVLVTDHWYTRVLDPRTLVMTGLTRNGVWRIEAGEIAGPVRNFRFTQSYPQALAPGAVLGVGSHPVRLPSSWELASYVAPALHLASWNFTGGGSG